MYHPRKGAKTDGCPAQSRTFSYHPSKGAKTSLPCHQSPCTRFHLLPARGRKLDAHVVGVRSIDFNFSPQGDGNVICCRSSPCNADFDLSPYGGENFSAMLAKATSLGTIPIRGRKLKVRFIIPVHSRTIPVRGRKPVTLKVLCPSSSTIPARGRKLDSLCLYACVSCTIPVRGRKLRVLLCVNLFELYHPRKGTKNSASKDAEFFFCKP